MADTVVEGVAPLPPEAVFDLYVNKIDIWWPRQGVFPYSFAPAGTRPHHIRFEPGEGGRLFETFDDGQEYEIGRILSWQKGRLLEYSWRDPNWAAPIRYTIKFDPDAGGTLISSAADGFAEAAEVDLIPYYAIGDRQILDVFLAHCRAVADLATFERAKQVGSN